ncbi:MAG: hypothetical protein RBS07_06260 [Lentimicrobium sp.]|jgi:hypothetical protein|nr:hypothetical protein [Lentimicrobium sp.]
MLEYSKTILQKVSFNRDLFRKELIKSVRWLHKEEIILLQIWCLATFNDTYSDILNDVFFHLSH